MHELDSILRPKSIAVIGASRRPNTIGWQILDNLLEHGFQGPVYPVNPRANSIHSILAYPSVAAIPGEVDLAIVVVPKERVLGVAMEAIDAGIKGLVVISAGFKEVGGDGLDRERELVELIRDRKLRMVGPNCMGVINTAPDVAMNATFAPSMPPGGPVAFVSQSGAMGVSVLNYAKSLGIGISMFVSMGNKTDVSGNDLIEYWKDDPDTKVILMYLESFGNPAIFVPLARSLTKTKPICIVKSGRTGAGAQAAASHTGALAATDLATDAIIAQAGAIRAQTVEELFDLAIAFANQPLPASNRVAIVTNAGGPGIIIADACESTGLEVAPLTVETQQRLREGLPDEASVRNPVDLIASATAKTYEFALQHVFDDPEIDAVLAAFVPPLGILVKDVAAAIVRVNEHHPEKPILAVIMGTEGIQTGIPELQDAKVPAYVFPESAARALATMWRQRQRISRPDGEVKEFGDVDDATVTAILDSAVASSIQKLSESDSLRILQAYKVPVARWRMVNAEGAGDETLAPRTAQAAIELGFPIVMKVVSPDITHKTDIGGVVLGIESAEETEHAVKTLLANVNEAWKANDSDTEHSDNAAVGPRIHGLLLQRMASGETETIIGITRIPRVGPMVMFGLGGIYVEVMRDVVLRLCPLTDSDSDEMIREVKLSSLLEGVRGQPPRDLGAIANIIQRMAQLASRHSRIVEMDINPLLALEHGVLAVDARVQICEDEYDCWPTVRLTD
jgi:acetyl coenzyme A synthetase (ADP forming)-like protein